LSAYEGLEAVLMDPLDKFMMGAVRTVEAIMGKDRHFRKYMRMFR
jgi:hypothetical protein